MKPPMMKKEMVNADDAAGAGARPDALPPFPKLGVTRAGIEQFVAAAGGEFIVAAGHAFAFDSVSVDGAGWRRLAGGVVNAARGARRGVAGLASHFIVTQSTLPGTFLTGSYQKTVHGTMIESPWVLMER